MAIVVEERKERLAFLNLVIWLTILFILGAGTYYIFFKKPALYEIAAPVNFENTVELVRISVNPNEVVQSPQFQALKQYVTTREAVAVGRSNPFVSF